jgi:hypothetical protein
MEGRTSAGGRQNKTAVIAVVIIGGLVFLFAIVTPLTIYGVKRYLTNAKSAEGKSVVMELATGIARCGSASGLPESTRPVPAALSDASGTKYHSKPSDWSDPTFRCASFARTAPQYFQYQWQRLDPSSGVARARADFDRDGIAETGFDVEVRCAGGACEAASTVTDVSTGKPALPRSARGTATQGPEPPAWLILSSILGMVALFVGEIWLLVVAFSDSVLWGFLVLCVPCAQLVFAIKNWPAARKPFLLQVASLFPIFVVPFTWVIVEASKNPRSAATVDSVAEASSPNPVYEPAPAPSPARPGTSPPEVVPSPAPSLDGKSAPPMEVITEAQARALKWDSTASLVLIEASGVVDGKVETLGGGSVSVSYRRIATSRSKNDQLVVSYDKAGFREQESRGTAQLPTLPNPICAPERVAQIAAGLEKSQARLNLKYWRDPQRERIVWVAEVAAGKKAPRTFDGQSCTILVR